MAALAVGDPAAPTADRRRREALRAMIEALTVASPEDRLVLGGKGAGLVRLLRLDKGRLLNSLLLPTDPLPPHDEYERQLHINPQSAGSLRAALQSSGFRVRRVDHWEPPQALFFPRELRWHNVGLGVLDAVRFLRPLSRLPPLNRLFSNHIWVVAERT